ncbi:hypothetical protein ACIBFB_12910 [Nocardiopsis sp. NPDC050513]|uniref:hypothetical protein n=1 Tax=Nocardiopsis sp. NPDC050513 TaxID=3364338 RepID=UPI0037AE4680
MEPEAAPGSGTGGSGGYASPAKAWFGTASPSDVPRPTPWTSNQHAAPTTREPRQVGAPRPQVVGVPGVEDQPNPDAEETDVFLVRGSERRARTKRVPDAPEAAATAPPEPVPAPPVAAASTEAEPSPSSWARAPGEEAPPAVASVSGDLPVPEPSVTGFLDGAHTPVPGGYEARIGAIKPVPVARLRRAVFAMTGGRVNLG